ncbi:MAG: tetratricopeptide repeat protein [Flavobacteriales bacterium]|nr:tetratricopeptide repeat protein [Flavobacteriales bacterium]
MLGVIGVKLLADHYRLISCPYPLEYREAHTPATTHLMLKGGDPYELAQQPWYTNVYGVAFNYICYPVVMVFGEGYPVYRAIVGFFIWCCCITLYLLLQRLKVPRLESTAATLIFYASLLYFVTPMVRPDSFGLFLFMVSLFYPVISGYGWRSLVVSMVCCIVAFYAKPYFLLASAFLAAYMFLFVSKKQGLIYGCGFALLLLISVLVVDQRFETYFSNAFFIYTNYRIDKFDYMIRQLSAYVKHSPGLIGLMMMGGYAGWRSFKGGSWKLNLKNPEAPAIASAIPLSAFVAVCIFLLFVYRLGQHQGAWLTYLFQLMSPFLLLATLPAVFRASIRYKRSLVMALLMINLGINAFAYLNHTGEVRYSEESWKLLKTLTEPANQVLNTPVIAMDLLQENKRVFDTGNSEYFQYGGERNGIWSSFLSPHPEIQDRWMEARREVNQMIEQQKFDLIVLGRGPRYLTDEAFYSRYYTLLVTIPIRMPHATMREEIQRFDVGVWEPKGKERPKTERNAIYQKLYNAYPDNFFVNYYLGFQLFEVEKDYRNAAFFLENAVAIDPSPPILSSALGAIYFNHLQDYNNALRHFSRAYQMNPQDKSARTNLGYTYRKLGDEKHARELLGE